MDDAAKSVAGTARDLENLGDVADANVQGGLQALVAGLGLGQPTSRSDGCHTMAPTFTPGSKFIPGV